jgi:putative component of toxin-antitoxin plasmid stabilization module
MARYEIVYFRLSSDRSPIASFLDELDLGARAKCLARIRSLAENTVPPGQREKLRGEIWELKIRHSGEQYRFLYSQQSDRVHLLVAYHKKRQKIPTRLIDQAEENLRLVREREG